MRRYSSHFDKQDCALFSKYRIRVNIDRCCVLCNIFNTRRNRSMTVAHQLLHNEVAGSIPGRVQGAFWEKECARNDHVLNSECTSESSGWSKRIRSSAPRFPLQPPCVAAATLNGMVRRMNILKRIKNAPRYSADYIECNRTEFRCKNGQCISIAHRCDLLSDCHDNSDEQDCLGECASLCAPHPRSLVACRGRVCFPVFLSSHCSSFPHIVHEWVCLRTSLLFFLFDAVRRFCLSCYVRIKTAQETGQEVGLTQRYLSG